MELAVEVGLRLGLSGQDLADVEQAAVLHDMGKLVTRPPDPEKALLERVILREPPSEWGNNDDGSRHRRRL